jgi:2-oxoglutarate dehydrogenase E2 component (dihydrolipoamide succinyltransferase)
MAQTELVMPKMGESIMEATILAWKKKVGDRVEQDETILEIATDKVDSEVPSPIAGVISKLLYDVNDVVPIGKVIALIETEVNATTSAPQNTLVPPADPHDPQLEAPRVTPSVKAAEIAQNIPFVPTNSQGSSATQVATAVIDIPKASEGGRFYSPLVRTIAKQESISLAELEAITGSGQEGRVTKADILNYVENKATGNRQQAVISKQPQEFGAAVANVQSPIAPPIIQPSISQSLNGNVEIIEMDRMRRLIADHMVMSKQVAPHVTSFVEADMTNIVNWRNKIKGEYQKKYGENITFTPIFIEAVCKALRDFPIVNSSVEGTKIIVKKDLNIGMAAALPSGNLIVPVLKGADLLSLQGLTRKVNDLANRARLNQLKPDEVQGGTFTLTNVGIFGNVMGTPIINQPQVAIMAAGVIKKKPAVMETEFGDVIAVRHMMFLSMSYDHRVVDGMMGGSFLRKVADYLEGFDVNRSI